MEHGRWRPRRGCSEASEPEREIPPEELFEKLEPFKRLVADDIREGPDS